MLQKPRQERGVTSSFIKFSENYQKCKKQFWFYICHVWILILALSVLRSAHSTKWGDVLDLPKIWLDGHDQSFRSTY